MLCTPIQERVVHDFIWFQIRFGLELFQQGETCVNIAGLTMTLHHGTVSDDIRADFTVAHVLEDAWHLIHTVATCACINEGIECDHRQLNLPFRHLFVDSANAVEFFFPCEPLQYRTINDGIQSRSTIFIFLHFVDELVSPFGIAIANHCLYHATQCDTCGLDVAATHLFPTSPYSINIFCMTISLDEAAECVGSADFEAAAILHCGQLTREQIGLPYTNTSLHHGRHQDLIHLFLHRSNKIHSQEDIGLRRVSIQILQQNGACHLVWCNSCFFHLPNYLPNGFLPPV
mmetsp:Transcript_29521/g.47511  ORF Transcript_29521/g.47511 Transcript_29521/m.47511 type:complete len:288 (+) Transcript_29521:685-1548(+)